MRRIHPLPMLLLSVGSAALFCGTLWAQDAPQPVSTVAAAHAPAPPAAAAGDAPLPSTKEILAKNDAAMGGTQAWERVTSRRMKGLYQTEDSSLFFSIEILQKSPNKSLYKINLPNDVVLRDVCDGHSAWIEDPRGGYHEVTGAGLASRLRRSEFLDHGKTFLLAATGKLVGTQKVGAHKAYVIEYIPEKNVVSRLFFDMNTGLIVHTEDVYTIADGPYTVKMDLDDYRDVDGLKFPYRMKLVEKGVSLNIRLTQVQNNAPIDDSIFLKPESSPK